MHASSRVAVVALLASLVLSSLASAQGAAGGQAPEPRSVEDSVVKVFSRRSLPDSYRPWASQSPQEITGSGVVIEGKRILTNAHVVSYSRQIQIQANEAGEKLAATVVAYAPGIDLALLKLDDETFFDSHAPVRRLGALPDTKDVVMAYGYPTGGSGLSITKGIVSRIDFTSYNFPTMGLRIQIDAAINPGNSGGPTMIGDKMIGLSYSVLSGSQSIGYIIPNEEIELFLESAKDGKYEEKGNILDDFQTLENPALRKYLKLGKEVHGLVVTDPGSSDPAYPLKQWDVVTRIGETSVDDQGMVKLKDNVRVSFRYRIQRDALGGAVAMTVVRDGKEIALKVPVQRGKPQLFKWLNGDSPSYFIYGPLVFSVATEDFLQGQVSGKDGVSVYNWLAYRGSPLAARRGSGPAYPGEQLVIVPSPLFPSKLSQGYDSPIGMAVESVNGTKVRNLRHLVELLRDCSDDFVAIDFIDRSGEAMVLPRAEVAAETERILNDNGIRYQGSPDALEVWEAKRK